jgi:hypothetical protein
MLAIHLPVYYPSLVSSYNTLGVNMKLFEFAIIYTPRNTKTQIDAGEISKSEILVPITSVLAKDKETANMLAARAIPETHVDKMDQLTIAIRDF